MVAFPNDLPPEGLDLVYKLLLYYGIIYVLTTAITTWLITRRRSFPKPEIIERNEPAAPVETVTTLSITEALSFADTKDQLASLKLEVEGAETSLAKLAELKQNGQVSDVAHQKLTIQYNDRVAELTTMINEMLQKDIEDEHGDISEGISEEEMESIEADLEQQLMDLESDDSFLKPRRKKKLDEVLEPAPPAQPKATPPQPATPQPASTQPKKVPMPPAPSRPSETKSEAKSVPMPPPPSKKSVAPPPPNTAAQPSPSPPQAATPSAAQPLSAAQPMKVKNEEDETMFAKSTSIAALRMDMLRELARLKKLIPEDQEKDQ